MGMEKNSQIEVEL